MRTLMEKAGLAALISMGLLTASPVIAMAAPVLPQGISVGSQSLAGMTAEEVRAVIGQYIDGMADRKVTLTIDSQKAETTAGALGFHWKNTEAVDEAMSRYAGGSLIHQYKTERKLMAEPVELNLETGVDSAKVKEFIDIQCKGMTPEPQNATITRVDGTFVITDSLAGKAVDREATEAALNQAMEGGLEAPVQVTARIIDQEPGITKEDLSSITDVLGTFTTDFSSSGSARATNVTVGAEKINGFVLMPGEVLSGYQCLQPFTNANGYKTAAAYENGQVVDSIGGGVCQISTTLYNAALEAELEIVQRQNHSMIVTYVKPSRDAAIAGTYKDIKIKNNYATPIYVEGYTSNRKITFTIYGKETRPSNRKVEYVSETLGSTSPGAPQLIVDNKLAPGQQVKVQSSHTGLRSRLWKVVTVDGVEQERTLLSTDTYNASKAIYRVGPALPAVVTPDPSAPVPTVPAPAESAPASGSVGGTGTVAPGSAERASGAGQTGAPSSPAPTESLPASAPNRSPATAQPSAPSPAPTQPSAPAPAQSSAPAPTPAITPVPEAGAEG